MPPFARITVAGLQNAIRDFVASLQNLHDHVRGNIRHVHLDHRLMVMRVELFSQGIETRNAVPLESLEKLALGCFDALKQRFEGGILLYRVL